MAASLRLDARPVDKRIGLIVLATDHTSERDFARACDPDEVGLYVTRIAFENPTTPDNLRRMQPRLTAAAALILPGEPLDALCYSCTAAAAVLGDDAVAAAIGEAKPGVPVVLPTLAARAAFRALEVGRVSVLTPYVEETGAAIAAYFRAHDVDVVSLACLGLADDREMARVSPAAIVELAVDAVTHDAEALFISCTALRAAGVAEEIERRIGKPVVTSNQASCWLALRAVGISRPMGGYGRLFTLDTREGVP